MGAGALGPRRCLCVAHQASRTQSLYSWLFKYVSPPNPTVFVCAFVCVYTCSFRNFNVFVDVASFQDIDGNLSISPGEPEKIVFEYPPETFGNRPIDVR